MAGVILQFSYKCPSLPGPFDQESIQTGSNRARSALACANGDTGFQARDAIEPEARQDHAVALECQRQ